MATVKQDGDPGPVVFVLFGATGDLAKRMVLPAFYRLACEGLLPPQWRLVGNGRGDVAHEDFRAHVHDALTEFGPTPEQQQWDAFADRVFFAGGGFDSDSPGSLLDVLDKARKPRPWASTGSLRVPASSTRSRSAPRGRISASSTRSSIRSWKNSRCTG
jgi:glucose-6-phosphate 1-dehydrogenase